MFEHDGGICCHCRCDLVGRTYQVHHKQYRAGKKLWEYPPSDCETLCRACHAALHGKIPPKAGWSYMADEDLGDLCGTCEYCGTELRYLFYIEHPNWGVMEVGTICCDNLTGTSIASDSVRYELRKRRFIESPQWKNDTISRMGVTIKIAHERDGFYVCIDGFHGRKANETIEDAKALAFDVIEKVNIKEFLANRVRYAIEANNDSLVDDDILRTMLKPLVGTKKIKIACGQFPRLVALPFVCDDKEAEATIAIIRKHYTNDSLIFYHKVNGAWKRV